MSAVAEKEPTRQAEEILAEIRRTTPGAPADPGEVEQILEEVRRRQTRPSAPVSRSAGERREGDTRWEAAEELFPALALPEPRRQTARGFFGALFLTLTLLGGLYGFVLVEESYRQVGMGSLPTEIFSARWAGDGIETTVIAPGSDPEDTRRLAWVLDRAEPFLLPRGLRVAARVLLILPLLPDLLP